MNFNFDPEHTFFTSDTHFNHANIIKFCNRPFKDVEQINETMMGKENLVDKPHEAGVRYSLASPSALGMTRYIMRF